MSGKKEHRVEGSKKSDKMIDPHREFLDMDTDEEDFGRQGNDWHGFRIFRKFLSLE